jgi:hypothetical protein
MTTLAAETEVAAETGGSRRRRDNSAAAKRIQFCILLRPLPAPRAGEAEARLFLGIKQLGTAMFISKGTVVLKKTEWPQQHDFYAIRRQSRQPAANNLSSWVLTRQDKSKDVGSE